MPKNSNKKNLIFSEAFPPNKRGYRDKLYPSSSSHSLLNGIKILPEEIVYKPLSQQNLEETKKLHKEWFPIDYSDKFFENIRQKKLLVFYYRCILLLYRQRKKRKKRNYIRLSLV